MYSMNDLENSSVEALQERTEGPQSAFRPRSGQPFQIQLADALDAQRNAFLAYNATGLPVENEKALAAQAWIEDNSFDYLAAKEDRFREDATKRLLYLTQGTSESSPLDFYTAPLAPEVDFKDDQGRVLLTTDEIKNFNRLDPQTKAQYCSQLVQDVLEGRESEPNPVVLSLMAQELYPEKGGFAVDAFVNDLKKDEEARKIRARLMDNLPQGFLENLESIGDYFAKGGDEGIILYDYLQREAPEVLGAAWRGAYLAKNLIEKFNDESLKGSASIKIIEELKNEKDPDVRNIAEYLIRNNVKTNDRTWLGGGTASLLESMGENLEMAFSNKDEETLREAARFTRDWRATQEQPTSWIGRGLKSTVEMIPSLTMAMAGGALAPATGGASAYTAASALAGMVAFGAQESADAFAEGSSRLGALTYGSSSGALQGVLGGAMRVSGALLRTAGKNAGKAALNAFNGRFVQKTIGESAKNAIKASVTKASAIADRTPDALKNAMGGMLAGSAFVGAVEPINHALGETYRAMGLDVKGDIDLKTWWDSFSFTSPEFVVPTLVLGGGLGALGRTPEQKFTSQLMKASRSEGFLEGMGMSKAKAKAIANSPNSRARLDSIIDELNSLDGKAAETNPRVASAALNLWAKRIEDLKSDGLNVESMPHVMEVGNGRWEVSLPNAKAPVTVSPEVARYLLVQQARENPKFRDAMKFLISDESINVFKRELGSISDKIKLVERISGINENVIKARTLSFIASNERLREDFEAGKISYERVSKLVEPVAAYRDGVIEIANGKVDALALLEEIVHAQTVFDLKTGAVSREWLVDGVKRYMEATGQDTKGFDFSQDSVLHEQLASMATALGTAKIKESQLPDSIRDLISWQKDAIGQMGDAIKEGILIKRCIEEGLLDKDFIDYLSGKINLREEKTIDNIIKAFNDTAKSEALPAFRPMYENFLKKTKDNDSYWNDIGYLSDPIMRTAKYLTAGFRDFMEGNITKNPSILTLDRATKDVRNLESAISSLKNGLKEKNDLLNDGVDSLKPDTKADYKQRISWYGDNFKLINGLIEEIQSSMHGVKPKTYNENKAMDSIIKKAGELLKDKESFDQEKIDNLLFRARNRLSTSCDRLIKELNNIEKVILSRRNKLSLEKIEKQRIRNAKDEAESLNYLKSLVEGRTEEGKKVAENNETLDELNKWLVQIDAYNAEKIKGEISNQLAAASRNFELYVASTQMRRYANRRLNSAAKNPMSKSRTIDAFARAQLMTIKDMAKLSEKQVNEIKEVASNRLSEAHDKGDVALETSIQEYLNYLEIFGGAFREGNDNLPQIRRATEEMNEIIRMGTLRWQKRLMALEERATEQKRTIAMANAENNNIPIHESREVDSLNTRLQEERNKAGEGVKTMFANFMSVFHVVNVLKHRKGMDKLGQWLEDRINRLEIANVTEAEKTQRTILSLTMEASRRANIKPLDFVKRMFEENITFKGHKFSLSSLIKLAQTTREQDGLLILRENYGERGIDLGDYKSLTKENQRADILLRNKSITKEQYEERIIANERAYQERLERDINQMKDLLGEDGVFLTDAILDWYRGKGKSLAKTLESEYGVVTMFDENYTPRNTANKPEGIFEGDCNPYSGSVYYRVGLPSYLKKRKPNKGTQISLRTNPFEEMMKYSAATTNWQNAQDLIEFWNKVQTDPLTKRNLELLMGTSLFNTWDRGLYNLVSAGRIHVQNTPLSQVMSRVMGAMAKSNIFFKLSSVIRSGVSIFNNRFDPDTPFLEQVKAVRDIAMGRYEGLSFKETLELPAMLQRGMKFNSKERALIEAVGTRYTDPKVQYLLWQNLGMNGLVAADKLMIPLSAMVTSHIYAKRGFSKDEIIEKTSASVFRTQQPVTGNQKPIMFLSRNGFELMDWFAKTDPVQKIGINLSYLWRKDLPVHQRLAYAIGTHLITGLVTSLTDAAACALFLDKDDPFSPESIAFGTMMGAFSGWGLISSLVQAADNAFFGGGHSMTRPANLLDFNVMSNTINKTIKTLDAVLSDYPVNVHDDIDAALNIIRLSAPIANLLSGLGGNALIYSRGFEVAAALSGQAKEWNNLMYRIDKNFFMTPQELKRDSVYRRRLKRRKPRILSGKNISKSIGLE